MNTMVEQLRSAIAHAERGLAEGEVARAELRRDLEAIRADADGGAADPIEKLALTFRMDHLEQRLYAEELFAAARSETLAVARVALHLLTQSDASSA